MTRKVKAKEDVAEEAAEVETKEESEPSQSEDQDEKSDDKVKKKKRRPKTDVSHPPTTEMIVEALMNLEERKGSSIIAVKKFIIAQHDVHESSLSSLLRKAFPKLLASETIMRPKGHEKASVMQGRYLLNPKTKKPKPDRERPASLRKIRADGKILKGTPKKAKKKKRRHW